MDHVSKVAQQHSTPVAATTTTHNTHPCSGKSGAAPVLDVFGGFDSILSVGGADILCSLGLIKEALSGLHSPLHGAYIGQQAARQAYHVITLILLQSMPRSVATA